jgi:lipoate-protein ligase B
MVIYIAHLGVTSYQQALRVQHAVHARCVKDGLNVLVLTEHLPVITLGYRRLQEQIRWPSDRLAEQGIFIVNTERGGGATYHGPGQLVAYPIFSSLLRRYGVRQFIARLEEVMCRVSQALGVAAVRRPGFPGVWVESRKLGAVGITVRRGVSLHGCALNVNLDLRPFSYIIPCGLTGVDMTSLQRETGTTFTMSEIETRMRQEFASVFAATLQETPDEWCSAE